MRIAIHQPNFLPWMGYFYKMAQCDTFVLLDHVEFTKKSYIRRVKIHKPKSFEEEQYLTVPLQKHSDHSKINQLQISNLSPWQKKIKAKIYETYHHTPFYHQVLPIVDSFFDHPVKSDSFTEFSIGIIKYVAQLLEIDVEWKQSSELEITYNKNKDLNLSIVEFLSGKTYISGLGAKKYQNEDVFGNAHIQLLYSDFPNEFQQLEFPHHFLNKSILSYLAYYDLADLKLIFQRK